MIYMYGIAREGAAPTGAAGVFGGALNALSAHGLTIIVEPVASAVIDATLGEGARGDETILHTAVLAHQAVLNGLVAQTDLLPFRFGTVVDDKAAATRLLAEDGEGFARALGRISGHLEWGVKIMRADEKAAPAKPASGADYLRALSAQRQSVADRQAEIGALCDSIAQSVYARSSAVTSLPLRSSDNRERRLLNLACLLPRGDETTLSTAIKGVAAKFDALPVTIEISGPWPPFTFSDIAGGDHA